MTIHVQITTFQRDILVTLNDEDLIRLAIRKALVTDASVQRASIIGDEMTQLLRSLDTCKVR